MNDRWMDGWATFLCRATSSLSDLFAEAPLLSTSLNYVFSGRPLLWNTSALTSELPPASVASATQLFFMRPEQCVLQCPGAIPHSTRVALWWKTTFRAAGLLQCVLKPQAASPLTRSVAESLMLCCAKPCHNAFCCSHLQTGKRRSVAPNRPTRPTWPTFARRQQCELDHTNPALLRPSGLFNDFYVTSSSRHDPVHVLPTSSSKSALNIVKWSSRCFVHFLPSSSSKRLQVVLTFFELSPQSCTLFVENFARWRPATAETETLLRRPQKPHYPKTIGFAPQSVFTHEFIRAGALTLL